MYTIAVDRPSRSSENFGHPTVRFKSCFMISVRQAKKGQLSPMGALGQACLDELMSFRSYHLPIPS